MAHAIADANCRFGPGLVYDVIGYFHSGQSSPIAGRNAETTWWWIDRLEAPGHCWVWAGAASTTGDLSGVPVVAAPPTPTPADTQPPTVSASYAPTGSGRPHQFEQVTFTALGSDDRALARLEIWVRPPGANAFTRVAVCEGTATCQHTAGPYAPGTLAYQAKAWDAAGNQAETPILQVTIHPSIF